LERAVAIAKQDGNTRSSTGNRQIRLSISIEITDRDSVGSASGAIGYRRLKSAIAVSQHNLNERRPLTYGQVKIAVAIKVAYGDASQVET
jgi:hypothetical protein